MKILKWGIVGTGRASLQFTQGLSLLPDAKIHSVVSKNYPNAQAFASVFNKAQACQTYEELLHNPEINIVYIGTPHTLHYEQSIQALKAGKHLLCEKPFTMNASEANEIIDLAKKKNLFCMEAMWMRFNPTIQAAINKIKEGEIGPVQTLTSTLGHSIAASPHHRLLNPSLGGGALMDLGVYPLSLAQQILGSPSYIISAFEIGKTGVDEQLSTTLSYRSGAIASISCSLKNKMGNDCLIMGTKGSIRIHAPIYRPIQLTISRNEPVNMEMPVTFNNLSTVERSPLLSKMVHLLKEKVYPVIRMKDTHNFHSYEGNGYHYQALEAMNCIRSGAIESRIMPHQETLSVMKTIDTLYSQKQGAQK